jgi:hypothetical protein
MSGQSLTYIQKCLSIMMIVAILVLNSGCTGGASSSSSSSVTPTPTVPGTPDEAPPNVVNSVGFYVKSNLSDKYLSFMTTGSTFNKACSIDPETTTNQDLVCTLDAQEGDLGFWGLELNYNVPPEMCSYLRFTPYFYYNYETGYGPKAVTLDVTESAGTSAVTACSVTDENNNVTAGCTGQLEVEINTADVTLTCKYDHQVNEGPNCCMGTYTLTKNITGTRTVTEVSKEKWGGEYGACMGGPGIVDWDTKRSSGFPAALVYNSDDKGLNNVFKVTGPMDPGKLRYGNFAVSNYYGGSTINHTHNGFVLARSTAKPYAIDPVDDRDGSYLEPANEYFKFECLDDAFEVKHRIRVRVREWNTYSEFLKFAAAGSAGDPDVGGVEDGVDCDYNIDDTDFCNDRADWDDFLNVQDGDLSDPSDTYDTTAGNEASRANWFPQDSDTSSGN